jgi:predicted dehydrogenase
MNAAEAREIAAAAGSAGRFCMEAMWTQFLPAVAVLERWIGEGRIGAPGLLQASFGVPTPSARPANGGALHDRGCYGVSLALRLLGPVRTIDARWRAGPDGRDLSASLLLVFDHGARAMIGCSLLDRLDNRLTVGGERGLMSLNDIACPTAILFQAAAEAQVHAGTDAQRPLREQFRRALRNAPALIQLRSILSARTQPQPCRGYGLVHEIEHVMVCLDEQRLDSPLHPLSRSIATLKVIDAVLGRSADDGGARR